MISARRAARKRRAGPYPSGAGCAMMLAPPGPLSRRERELPESQSSRAAGALAGVGYAALALAAVATPLAVARLDPPWLSSSYGRSYAHFELLGATGALALLAAAACELRRRGARTPAERLRVALPFGVVLLFLLLVSEYSRKPFDYDCYEYAGRALLAGLDPYERGLIYLYPPLTAQLFALAHAGVEWGRGLVGLSPDPEAAWGTLFYLYQCAQLGLVGLACALLVRFARGAGFGAPSAHWLAAGLLVLDHALLRTLRHGQINLWILDLSLLGVLLARSRPLLSGVAIAFAVHLKLYPLLLLVPLALDRSWRAAAWTLAALAAIALASTGFGRDLALWEAWLGFVSSGVRGEIAFRNSGLHSLFFNLFRFAGASPGGSGRGGVDAAVAAASLALGAWFLVRVARRTREGHARALEGRARALAGDAAAPPGAAALGNAADALAFALLLSPSVWEHHYVLALPLAVWAVATGMARHPAGVALGIFLVLALPSADVFLLGHHRMAGTLLLLWLTPPGSLPNSASAACVQSRDSQARI
jgi:hypothetical protein